MPGHDDPPPHPLPSRRAEHWFSRPAPSNGRGVWTPTTTGPPRRPIPGSGRRPQTSWLTWALSPPRQPTTSLPRPASTDTTPPTSTVSAPTSGTTISQGSLVTVTGTAQDVGGIVAGVEVSIDGGSTWHPANGTTNWSYSGILTGNGPGAIQVRATDDSARTQASPTKVAINSPCPCSIFGVAKPRLEDANDASSVTLGVKFTSSTRRLHHRRAVLQGCGQHRSPHRHAVLQQRGGAGYRNVRQRER